MGTAFRTPLGVAPGLAPLTVSDRAIERLLPVPQSWYLDIGLLADYVGSARRYHHTAPISMIMSLHAGLGAVLDEGLENVRARHQAAGDAVKVTLAFRGSRENKKPVDAVVVASQGKEIHFGAFLPEDVKEHLAGLIRHYYGDAPSAEPFVVEPEAGR